MFNLIATDEDSGDKKNHFFFLLVEKVKYSLGQSTVAHSNKGNQNNGPVDSSIPDYILKAFGSI